MAMIQGMKVIQSSLLMDRTVEPRSWRERLLSWPWRPLVRTKVVSRPSKKAIITDGVIFVHPVLYRQLERLGAFSNEKDIQKALFH